MALRSAASIRFAISTSPLRSKSGTERISWKYTRTGSSAFLITMTGLGSRVTLRILLTLFRTSEHISRLVRFQGQLLVLKQREEVFISSTSSGVSSRFKDLQWAIPGRICFPSISHHLQVRISQLFLHQVLRYSPDRCRRHKKSYENRHSLPPGEGILALCLSVYINASQALAMSAPVSDTIYGNSAQNVYDNLKPRLLDWIVMEDNFCDVWHRCLLHVRTLFNTLPSGSPVLFSSHCLDSRGKNPRHT
jgi:hypothetical protein